MRLRREEECREEERRDRREGKIEDEEGEREE
jgi:hypothetical protein